MPAKKTVTLATPCTKTGHKRIVYIDAKTQKTSYPCRKVAKARVGPSTKCPFTGEERKLVIPPAVSPALFSARRVPLLVHITSRHLITRIRTTAL